MIVRSDHAVKWALSIVADRARNRLSLDIATFRSSNEAINILIQHQLITHAITLIIHQFKHINLVSDLAVTSSAWKCCYHLQLATLCDLMRLSDIAQAELKLANDIIVPTREDVDAIQVAYQSNKRTTIQSIQLASEAWIMNATMLRSFGSIDASSSLRNLAHYHATRLAMHHDDPDVDHSINQWVLYQCDRLARDILRDELELDAAIVISIKLIKTFDVHLLYRTADILTSNGSHPWTHDFDVTCAILTERYSSDGTLEARLVALLDETTKLLQRDVISESNDEAIWKQHIVDCCIAHAQVTVAETIISNQLQHTQPATNNASCSLRRYAFELFERAGATLSQHTKSEAGHTSNKGRSNTAHQRNDVAADKNEAFTISEHERARTLLAHARAHLVVPSDLMHNTADRTANDSLSHRQVGLSVALQIACHAEALLQAVCTRLLPQNSMEKPMLQMVTQHAELDSALSPSDTQQSHPLQRRWADACILIAMIECHRWRIDEPEKPAPPVDATLLRSFAPVVSRTGNTLPTQLHSTTMHLHLDGAEVGRSNEPLSFAKESDVTLHSVPPHSAGASDQIAQLERKMLARWENRYADVFTDLTVERTTSCVPYSALSWAAKGHYLLTGSQSISTLKRPQRNHHSRSQSTSSVATALTEIENTSLVNPSVNSSSSLWLGLAGLHVIIQSTEQIKSRETIDKLLIRRSREQRMWHQQLFGPDPLEVERVNQEMDKVANDLSDLSIKESVDQLVIEAEAVREAAHVAAQEAEAAKSKKGKAALKSPVPSSNRTAATVIPEPQRVANPSPSPVSASEIDPRIGSLWADDNSEWSPLHLISWIQECERARALLVQTAAAPTSQQPGQARPRRQMSMASIPTDSLDDDTLDPSILLDHPFDDQPLHQSVYSHLSATVDQALRAHRFDVVCPAALALVHLFTTRSPVLSSKYLALHLSALVSSRLQTLNQSVSSSMEQAVSNKLQRLRETNLSVCTEAGVGRCVGWLEQTPATLEESNLQSANHALSESINEATNQSISHEWESLLWPLGVEGESDLSIDGWDGVYASMLVGIPSSVSVCHVLFVQSDVRAPGQSLHQRINQSVAEEGVLYISLTASTGFPLSTRFSRTVLDAHAVRQLVEAQTFFAQLDTHIKQALRSHADLSFDLSSSPRLNQASHPLIMLQETYLRHLAIVEDILESPLRRALIDDRSINERDIILLTDDTLFPVPFEALRQFKCAKSLCRDLSLAAFYRRCESISAEPINRKALSVVVHTDPNSKHSLHRSSTEATRSPSANSTDSTSNNDVSDVMTEAAMPLLAMASCKIVIAKEASVAVTQGTTSSHGQWLTAFSHARQSGAFVSFGFGGKHPRAHVKQLAHTDARGIRLAVLMARAVTEAELTGNEDVELNDPTSLSPYEISLLLSSRGVNTLLLGLHSMSSPVSSTATRLVSLSLSSQQSVAACLKQIQSCTEVPPSLAALSRQHSPIAARSQVTSPRVKTSRMHLSPTQTQNKLSVFEFGLQSGSHVPADDFAVRMFDRYNTVIMGLPHWRL